MKCTVVFLLIFFCFNIHLIESEIELVIRSLKCHEIDREFLELEMCKLKAMRGKKGVLNIILKMLKPIPHPYAHLRLFYRTSSGNIIPYLVNMDMDICDAKNLVADANPMLKMIRKLTSNMLPESLLNQIRGGCPITVINITDYEPNERMRPLLPPVIPNGHFKVVIRVHDPSNHTYYVIEINAELKTLGVSDFIKMG
uniref:CSON002151 protein n=1 Tax=Culicoides sonorensis TaxID=179676 RepID=A0A336MJV0_CULSO